MLFPVECLYWQILYLLSELNSAQNCYFSFKNLLIGLFVVSTLILDIYSWNASGINNRFGWRTLNEILWHLFHKLHNCWKSWWSVKTGVRVEIFLYNYFAVENLIEFYISSDFSAHFIHHFIGGNICVPGSHQWQGYMAVIYIKWVESTCSFYISTLNFH